MDVLREILTLGGAVASILGFVGGFFAGGPYWRKRGTEAVQKQTQEQGGRVRQSQEQEMKF